MSRYTDMVSVLREDEAVLYRAWIARTTVHQQPLSAETTAKLGEYLGVP